jgi:hypothetical protein
MNDFNELTLMTDYRRLMTARQLCIEAKDVFPAEQLLAAADIELVLDPAMATKIRYEVREGIGSQITTNPQDCDTFGDGVRMTSEFRGDGGFFGDKYYPAGKYYVYWGKVAH